MIWVPRPEISVSWFVGENAEAFGVSSINEEFHIYEPDKKVGFNYPGYRNPWLDAVRPS